MSCACKEIICNNIYVKYIALLLHKSIQQNKEISILYNTKNIIYHIKLPITKHEIYLLQQTQKYLTYTIINDIILNNCFTELYIQQKISKQVIIKWIILLQKYHYFNNKYITNKIKYKIQIILLDKFIKKYINKYKKIF